MGPGKKSGKRRRSSILPARKTSTTTDHHYRFLRRVPLPLITYSTNSPLRKYLLFDPTWVAVTYVPDLTPAQSEPARTRYEKQRQETLTTILGSQGCAEAGAQSEGREGWG